MPAPQPGWRPRYPRRRSIYRWRRAACRSCPPHIGWPGECKPSRPAREHGYSLVSHIAWGRWTSAGLISTPWFVRRTTGHGADPDPAQRRTEMVRLTPGEVAATALIPVDGLAAPFTLRRQLLPGTVLFGSATLPTTCTRLQSGPAASHLLRLAAPSWAPANSSASFPEYSRRAMSHQTLQCVGESVTAPSISRFQAALPTRTQNSPAFTLPRWQAAVPQCRCRPRALIADRPADRGGTLGQRSASAPRSSTTALSMVAVEAPVGRCAAPTRTLRAAEAARKTRTRVSSVISRGGGGPAAGMNLLSPRGEIAGPASRPS